MILRSAAGAVHNLGSLSLALWRVVLLVQNFPDRNDVVGIDTNHYGVHCGTLYGYLSSAASTCCIAAAAGDTNNLRSLVGSVRHCPTVPTSHQNVLLPGRSHATRASSYWFAYLQYSYALAVANALFLPGKYLLVTSNQHVKHTQIHCNCIHKYSSKSKLILLNTITWKIWNNIQKSVVALNVS